MMCRMEKAFPEDYNFVPGTWILPAEYPFNFVQSYVFSNYIQNLFY